MGKADSLRPAAGARRREDGDLKILGDDVRHGHVAQRDPWDLDVPIGDPGGTTSRGDHQGGSRSASRHGRQIAFRRDTRCRGWRYRSRWMCGGTSSVMGAHPVQNTARDRVSRDVFEDGWRELHRTRDVAVDDQPLASTGEIGARGSCDFTRSPCRRLAARLRVHDDRNRHRQGCESDRQRRRHERLDLRELRWSDLGSRTRQSSPQSAARPAIGRPSPRRPAWPPQGRPKPQAILRTICLARAASRWLERDARRAS